MGAAQDAPWNDLPQPPANVTAASVLPWMAYTGANDDAVQEINSERFKQCRMDWVDDFNVYISGSSSDNGTANGETVYSFTLDLNDGSISNSSQVADGNRPQGNSNNCDVFRHGGAMHRLRTGTGASGNDMYLEGDAFIPQGSGGLPVSDSKYGEDNLVATYTCMSGCQVNGNDLGMFHIDGTNIKVSITTVTESSGNIGYNIGSGSTIFSSETARCIHVLQVGIDRVFMVWQDTSADDIHASVVKPKPTLAPGTKTTLVTGAVGADTTRVLRAVPLSLTQVAVFYLDVNVHLKMVVCDIDVANQTVTPGSTTFDISGEPVRAGDEPWFVDIMDIQNKVIGVVYVKDSDDELYYRSVKVTDRNNANMSTPIAQTSATTVVAAGIKKHPRYDLAVIAYSVHATSKTHCKLIKP